MRNWFRPRPAGGPDQIESYREGRVDEARALNREGATGATQAEIKDAYERGRLRERALHRGSPLFGFLAFLAIVLVGSFIYLAARNGSFSSGGAVVDNGLTDAAHQVKAPLSNAAENAGSALQKAGQSLK